MARSAKVAVFLAIAVGMLSGCTRKPDAAEGAASDNTGRVLHYQFTGATPTNHLQAEVMQVADTFHYADSVLVRYRVYNPGAAQVLRDFPEFYYFDVIGPDGKLLSRVFHGESLANKEYPTLELSTGESTPWHVINLACMPYHPVTFEPRFPWSFKGSPVQPCQMVYEFKRSGHYQVIAQHIPASFEDPPSSPEFMPSRADTTGFYFILRPRPLGSPDSTPSVRNRP